MTKDAAVISAYTFDGNGNRLTGPGLAHDEFKAWCGKHQAVVAKALVGSEKVKKLFAGPWKRPA